MDTTLSFGERTFGGIDLGDTKIPLDGAVTDLDKVTPGSPPGYAFEAVVENGVANAALADEPPQSFNAKVSGSFIPSLRELYLPEMSVATEDGMMNGSLKMVFAHQGSPAITFSSRSDSLSTRSVKQLWPFWFAAKPVRCPPTEKNFQAYAARCDAADGIVAVIHSPDTMRPEAAGDVDASEPIASAEKAARVPIELLAYEPTELRFRAHVAHETVKTVLDQLEQIHDRRKILVWVSEGYDYSPYQASRYGLLGPDSEFTQAIGSMLDNIRARDAANPSGDTNPEASREIGQPLKPSGVNASLRYGPSVHEPPMRTPMTGVMPAPTAGRRPISDLGGPRVGRRRAGRVRDGPGEVPRPRPDAGQSAGDGRRCGTVRYGRPRARSGV